MEKWLPKVRYSIDNHLLLGCYTDGVQRSVLEMHEPVSNIRSVCHRRIYSADSPLLCLRCQLFTQGFIERTHFPCNFAVEHFTVTNEEFF